MTATMPNTSSDVDQAFATFFLPGPTAVHPAVLAAMSAPMIAHRGKGFEAMFARLQEGLRDVFRTARPVYVSSSSATGLMEASMRCAPPGPVLAVVNGAFSERFAHIAQACGRDVDVLAVPWGRAADPGDVQQQLGARRYGVLAVVHSETSTGALTDVRTIAALARDAGTCCLVDSVTGIAGTPLYTDDWALDFALTGSQKALALPPGLAFGVASAGYAATAAQAPNRGLYFDLVEFEEFVKKNQTPNTPALPLLYALDAQLARIREETLEARWARHAAMAEHTYRWVAEREERFGLGILAPAGERSPTVTVVTVPESITGDDVVKAVAKRGWTIGGGHGKLRTISFRIGHMGDHTTYELSRCLDVCDDALAELLG
jgi:aspartate aminotransferase-like enzyme